MLDRVEIANERILVEPLGQEAFAPFGQVVEKPQVSSDSLPHNAVEANQGTAIKYQNVTDMTNFYDRAPSRVPGRAVMNMFSCAPRELRYDGAPGELEHKFKRMRKLEDFEAGEVLLFDVNIMERHPYTFQTFVPMGMLGHSNAYYYLVIVAPTLPDSEEDEVAVSVNNNGTARSRWSLLPHQLRPKPAPRSRSAGMPDLRNTRAFLAHGNQAVTYAAGTWHSPMVVLGPQEVDFVVVQHSNGVAREDCEEVQIETTSDQSEGLVVVLDLAVFQTAFQRVSSKSSKL